MSLWISAATIAAAAAGAVMVMRIVRRRAPEGGFFTDLDRAAGVFGVLGTFFAVVLAFVIFVAFESYVNAKDKAGQEAVAVTALYHTAQLYPAPARQQLAGQMVCYGRAVVDDEWPAMRKRRQSDLVQGWVGGLDAGTERLDLRGEEGAAFGHWLDQSSALREGRRGRLAEAKPFVPGPLWLVLVLGAALLVTFMCFFADRREPFLVQAMMIGAITAVVVCGLLVIRFLDRPYENTSGSIKPVEMRQTLELIDHERRLSGRDLRPPCDARGRPRARA